MKETEIIATTQKIFQAIFGQDCPYGLSTLREKFAFDIKLPLAVQDTTTGETTYSAMPNAEHFITEHNSHHRDVESGWLLPRRPFKSLKELLAIWQEINYTTTERVYDSEEVAESDAIYRSRAVYASTNCGDCDHIIFCDGTYDSSYSIACQRSTGLNFCLRTDDSNSCTNCYNVINSGKASNCFFVQDASNLHECLFCSHLSNQEYCIANMQFEKSEYEKLKRQIVRWMLK